MAEYQADYYINVFSEKATQNITAFQAAVDKLTACSTAFDKVTNSLTTLETKLAAFTKKPPVININTEQAGKKLDGLIAKLQEIRTLAQGINVNMSVRGSRGGSLGGSSSKGGSRKAAGNTGMSAAEESAAGTTMAPMGMSSGKTGHDPLDKFRRVNHAYYTPRADRFWIPGMTSSLRERYWDYNDPMVVRDALDKRIADANRDHYKNLAPRIRAEKDAYQQWLKNNTADRWIEETRQKQAYQRWLVNNAVGPVHAEERSKEGARQAAQRRTWGTQARARRRPEVQQRIVNKGVSNIMRAARTVEAGFGAYAAYEQMAVNPNAIYDRHQLIPSARQGSATNTSSKSAYRATRSPLGRSYPVSPWPNKPSNLIYKAFGPTPLPGNGGMVVDMLKGMGIMYGISGVGALFSNIIQQSVAYDNTMKTVENILKSHDNKDNFGGRLAAMQQTVRNVGMETKYKVTEVADAAKFLAMAGLNVDAIQNAIRPIADVALIGDTDLGETADLVTNVMTAYNIRPTKMRKTADIMTNTFTMSNTTLLDIAEAYKYSASLLSAGKVKFEESAAAIGVLGNAGIKGSQAGTTLRTIMANIVNPTKKQKKAWDALNLNPSGFNNLMDVFQALNAKNLDVADYYKLFHKTAAQGAVALTAHVSDWKNINAENHLSGGIAKQLADEKKNTIQGLWAQLTSVFTDNGVSAFASIDGFVRNTLKTAIEYLKSDEAKRAFDQAFKAFVEFGNIIKSATSLFAECFSYAKPFIFAWAKFQLYIWPVVTAFKAFRSVLLGFSVIKNIAISIRGLAASFFTLKGAMKWLGTVNSVEGAQRGLAVGMGAAPAGLGFSWLSGTLTRNQMRKVMAHSGFARPHASMTGYTISDIDTTGMMTADEKARIASYNQGVYARREAEDKASREAYRKNRRRLSRRIAGYQMLNSMKGMAGSAVGMAGMGLGLHEMTRSDGNSSDKWTGGFLSLAGMSAMFGGPLGWGVAAGSAIAAGISYGIARDTRIKEAMERLRETTSKFSIENGIITNSENKIQQSLDAVYNKHDGINGLISHRINMMKELLGLTNQESGSTGTTTELYEKMMEDWKTGGKKSKPDQLNEFVPKDYGEFRYNGGETEIKTPGRPGYMRVDVPGEAIARSVAATTQLMQGGYYENTMASLAQNAYKVAFQGGTPDVVRKNWSKYFAAYNQNYNPNRQKNLIHLNQITADDLKDPWSAERVMQDYEARRTVFQHLQEFANPLGNIVNTYLTAWEKGTLTDQIIADYMAKTMAVHSAGEAMANYNANDPNAWFKSFGFVDGTFQSMNIQNPKTGKYEFMSAKDAAASALQFMSDVTEALGSMGLQSDPAADAIRTYAGTMMTAAQAFLGEDKNLLKYADGHVEMLNGIKFKYDAVNNWWNQVKNDDPFDKFIEKTGSVVDAMGFYAQTMGGFKVGMPMGDGYKWLGPGLAIDSGKRKHNKGGFSNEEFSKAYNYSKQNNIAGGGGNGDDDGTKTPHYNGPDQSRYKSHYNSNTAAPKQVIVKIDKLLSVEKVDLTKKENAEAVESLKSELAQALIDVVHNFDETWHG